MSKRILSHDKETGLIETMHYDSTTDTMTIEHSQDVTKALEHTKNLAKDGDYTSNGMKGDNWLHYCHVPDIVILEIKKKYGLDLYNPDHMKAVFRVINTEYPALKTTTIRHNPKG